MNKFLFVPIILLSFLSTPLVGKEAKKLPKNPMDLAVDFLAAKNRSGYEPTEEELKYYQLPEDSEIKAKLDEIFGKKRVTLNSDTLVEAGFTTGKPRKYSRIVVTKHKSCPGYVFKIYLDNEKRKPEERAHHYMMQRILGANSVRHFITEHHLDHLFKVPRKWLYALPEVSKPKRKYSYKRFILVTEDMHILDEDANKKAWKSKQVTEETLSGLYNIVKQIGLIDCAKIDNIPFCHDGKITFIDTESFGHDRVLYRNLKGKLSSKMRHIWMDLVHHK